MKIDVSALVLDLDEKAIKQGKRGEEEDLNVGDVMTGVLLGGAPDEKDVSAKVKLDRFDIAYRIRQAQKVKESCELSPSEVETIRELVGKCGAALVVGRVFKHLQITGE